MLKQAIIKDNQVFCSHCNENLTNSQIADYDLVQNINTGEKVLCFIRRCLACGDKSLLYKRNFSINNNGEYFIDDEDNWTKIKEERKEFKEGE